MRRFTLGAVLMMGLIGCGADEPLRSGDPVVLESQRGGSVEAASGPGGSVVVVPGGTRAVVLAELTVTQGEQTGRAYRVRVEGGPLAGREVFAAAEDVRLAP